MRSSCWRLWWARPIYSGIIFTDMNFPYTLASTTGARDASPTAACVPARSAFSMCRHCCTAGTSDVKVLSAILSSVASTVAPSSSAAVFLREDDEECSQIGRFVVVHNVVLGLSSRAHREHGSEMVPQLLLVIAGELHQDEPRASISANRHHDRRSKRDVVGVASEEGLCLCAVARRLGRVEIFASFRILACIGT